MVDTADTAQALEELQRKLAITQITNVSNQISAETCDCGRPISEQRQKLLPGVQNCVICQEEIERSRKYGRR